jgi:hypothetical protein
MLDFLTNIAKPVLSYKSDQSDQYKTVFKEISPVYYHENFHSDIIAYYLNNKIVKEVFIQWLNKNINHSGLKIHNIDINDYKNGEVKREEGRIDILLLSNDGSKAIIIENKSNNASDQLKQLYRYYDLLTKNGKLVEAIFYLSKSTISFPDLHDLKLEQKEKINKILVSGQLTGDINGFCEKVIDKVINLTQDIRLKGLSMEIRDLFYYIVYGDMNMENLEQFAEELQKNGNLKKLEQAWKAYNDLPEYYAKTIKDYIDSKNKGYKVRLGGSDCLSIDFLINNTTIKFDIQFFRDEGIWADIYVHKGKRNDLENFKVKMASKFPFTKKTETGYDMRLDNLFEANKLKKIIDNVFKTIEELNT